MAGQREGSNGGAWLSVPAFGDWDQKQGGVPDYSIDFSKIREMRKQNKKDISRISVGNEEELVNPTAPAPRPPPPTVSATRSPLRSPSGSPTKREKIMRYLNCCVSV